MAQLDSPVLAPGRFLDFKMHGYETHFWQPPLTTGDDFTLPFHGAVLKGRVLRANPETALIAIESARYNLKRVAAKWRIASKV